MRRAARSERAAARHGQEAQRWLATRPARRGDDQQPSQLLMLRRRRRACCTAADISKPSRRFHFRWSMPTAVYYHCYRQQSTRMLTHYLSLLAWPIAKMRNVAQTQTGQAAFRLQCLASRQRSNFPCRHAATCPDSSAGALFSPITKDGLDDYHRPSALRETPWHAVAGDGQLYEHIVAGRRVAAAAPSAGMTPLLIEEEADGEEDDITMPQVS